jgi:hypothetical protein
VGKPTDPTVKEEEEKEKDSLLLSFLIGNQTILVHSHKSSLPPTT